MKNVAVYYQKDFNPFAKYNRKNFAKTHVKVFDSVINSDTIDEEIVFKIFNNDETNPLSYANKTKQVCIIDKDTIGTGADFQEAMKNGKTKCFHTSMSAGDIVSVNGVTYLCQNFGWEVLK